MKKIISLIFIILLFGCENRIEKSNRLIEESHYEAAIKILTELINENNSAYDYFMRGICYISLYEDKKAIDDWLKAVELAPELSYRANLNISGAYHRLGEYEKAFDFIQIAATETSSEEPLTKSEILADAGNYALIEEKFDVALKNFNEALICNPNNTNAILGKSMVLLAEGKHFNPEEGEKYAKIAYKLTPNIFTLFTVAEANFKNKKGKESLGNLQHCLNVYGHLASPQLLSTIKNKIKELENSLSKLKKTQ